MSAVGGAMNAYGQNKQNKAQAALFSPGLINKRATQLSPWSFAATQMPGYKQAWEQIGNNPGYIDPSLQAYAMMQNDRGWQQALQRLQASIGRSGMTGGLAQAHTLAAYGGLGMGRARIAQQFALWKEQQKRADMGMISGEYGRAQNTAMGLASQQAQYPQVPWQSIAGNAIQGFNANIMPYLMQYWQRGAQQTPTGGWYDNQIGPGYNPDVRPGTGPLR